MWTIVAVLLGAFLGGAWGHEANVLFGALLGWLVVRSLRQGRQLAELRKLRDAAPAVLVPSVAAPPAAEPPVPERPVVEPLVPEPVPAAATLAASAPDVAPAQSPAPPADDPLAPLRRWLFGGNTIVKAGVGILFIGLAFLAKYASEHVQLPIELRLAGVALAALVLLGLGWRLRGRRPEYAQVLQGGAVAVLYLTLFAAFRFYGVLQGLPAFALMVAVAGLAAALAVLQEAPALAAVGALGGFATPLLVSTGQGNPVALFSYYLVLDLGIAAIAWFRTWRVLNVIGFACTFLVATAWGVLKYEPDRFAMSEGFLAAYFLLFIAVLLLPARRVADDVTEARARWLNGSLLFGLPTISFALQYGLVRGTEYGAALSSLAFAAFYVGLALLLRGRRRLALVFEASLAIATIFLTLVIPFALDARSTAGAWSLEGAGLVWLGLRQSRWLPRVFGYLLLFLAGAAMVTGHAHAAPITTLWNATFFNALLAATGSLLAAHALHRHAGALGEGERVASPLLIGWATLWLLSGALLQIEALLSLRDSLAAWVGVLSGIAALYGLLGHRLQWPQVTRPVQGHMPLMLVAALASALLQRHPLHHGGWWAWPLALAVQAGVLRAAAPRWPAGGQRLVHALGAILLGLLGALLGRATTADWGDDFSAWPWLGWLVLPALLLLWLPLTSAARAWPLRLQPQAYQRDAAAVLSLAGLWWVFLANIVSNGAAQPLPYVPLVNPLDLGLALALFAIWRWWLSPGATALRDRHPGLGPVLAGGLGFLWLNGMLLRSFHHHGGVPYHPAAWFDSLAVQTGLTLLWSTTALALMWLSARRAARALWLTGAVLLGVVVLKLLLVDLSGSGTVARIVSFIGVGVLMLVIGYVAPLPAAAVEEQHAK
ncbi:DUF2339 domain-containing protein [Aquabacterium sp.]|uniref:DUF2339 domain-containing protein n=1 Tax=Aquabacterium sp. TaxID=1872578 RepID=UPI00378484F6